MGDKQTSRTRTHIVATSNAGARVSAHTINNHRVFGSSFFSCNRRLKSRLCIEVERIQSQVKEYISKVL